MKAKERQRLKQNDFAETASRVLAELDEHRNQAALVAIIVIVVIAVAGGAWYWRKHTTDEAGALLGIATALAQEPIAPASTLPGAGQQAGTFPTEQARADATRKAYQAVIDRYPSSHAAAVAEYNLASLDLKLGKFDDARQAFQKVSASDATSVYRTMARIGEAQALVGAGKYDEAIKALTDLAAERDSTLPVDGVLMQLAQADLKAGKTADARAAFKRVVDEFPDSAYASDAKQQMTALE